MKKILIALFTTFVMFCTNAPEGLDYFLPDNVSYDKDIPRPDQFFKQQLGEWHLTHDQILNYMKEIANISERAII